MLILSEKEILDRIDKRKSFEATLKEGGLIIKVAEYVAYVCTAIHDGHKLRTRLIERCALSEAERLYEEDPYTNELISSMPITLIAQDSRYEYDLNRAPAECIYDNAWGKNVWKSPLDNEQIQLSRDKHSRFYRILNALIASLEIQFEACVIYDLHSYNYKRLGQADTPTFNLGLSQVDTQQWKNEISHFQTQLGKIRLPNIEVNAAKNVVFQGKGYLASFIQEHFQKTLALPTEIKKVFMDEMSGEVFPLVLSELKVGLKNAITLNAAYFSRRHTTQRTVRKSDVLASNLEPIIKKVDHELYHIAKGVETLLYINPVNLQHEKKRFFSRKYKYTPDYKYRQLNIDPYLFREKLYHLPVDDIKDISIQNLYRVVIDSFAEKINLLTSIGTDQFLYNSLKYYGEPDATDIDNAKFILYAGDMDEVSSERYQAPEVKLAFEKAMESYGIQCRVELSTKIIAGAMVNNSRKTILINKHKSWSSLELNALIHHELGVHMVTTINADLQPLKVFKLGMPGNTYAQEGLAILSEYLSGNLSLERLRILALRVLAVNMLVKKYSFSRTFEVLIDEYGLDNDTGFDLVARVYRGGGFTKDYLYLKGLRDAYRLFQNKDISSLYVGKTSFKYLSLINELIDREIILPPKHIPKSHTMKHKTNVILDYIVNSIR